jgi:beta-N-acetylhexosaminidase
MTAVMRAAIIGLQGTGLTPDEIALFEATPPLGVILFARNIENPVQLSALCSEIRGVLPAGAVIAVDQEGGRVQRLRPPHWAGHKAAADIASEDEAFAVGGAIGAECREAGIDLVCAPVLDRRVKGANEIIGDRAYGPDPATIIARAGAMARGLLAQGVMPVGKHAPGHGRALVDSHLALPVLDRPAPEDLEPFQALKGLPWLMTAHILFTDLDDRPATLSARVIRDVIRGEIGFDGLLITDDLGMKALQGTTAELAVQAIGAGVDVALACAGTITEAREILGAVPELSDAALRRLRAARRMVTRL